LAAPEKAGSVEESAISPDGHHLVMRLVGDAGVELWVRATDSLQTQLLAGTGKGDHFFWSPDSRYIGFFADGKLKKVAVTGGPAETLCDAPNGRGGTWNQDGVILFTPTFNGGLSRVPVAGGVPAVVTKAKEGAHRNPSFLPDGRRFLMAANGSENGIYLGSLDEKGVPLRRLLGDLSSGQVFQWPSALRPRLHPDGPARRP
jgi:serine/threonine-protein kinase